MLAELRTFCGLCGLCADCDGVIRGPTRAVLRTSHRSTAGRGCRLPRVGGRALRVPAGWACGPPFPRPAAAGWKPVVEAAGVCGRASQAPRHVPAAGVGTAAGIAGSTVESASSRCVPPAIQSCVTLAIAAAPQASTMSRSRDRIFGVMAAPLLIVGEGGPTRSAGLHVGVAAKSSEADPTGMTSPARALNSNPQ
jgi:hypothetical protein